MTRFDFRICVYLAILCGAHAIACLVADTYGTHRGIYTWPQSIRYLVHQITSDE